MTPAHFGGQLVADGRRAYTGKLVGSDRHADAGPTDQYAAIDIVRADLLANQCGKVRIVDTVGRLGADVDHLVPGRLERRNEWTCNLARENPSLVPFINLDPLQDEATMTGEILDKVTNHGAKGIKLHPGSQRFYPNDRRLWPAYRTAQEMGLPVIFHGGRFVSPAQYAQPKNFVEVLEAFPNMVLVMAHIGTGYEHEAISLARTYPSLQFDCSAIISHTAADAEVTRERLAAIIREIGVERVMFGSDFPWYDPADAAERLHRMDFSEEEKRLLFAENAIRIYKLEVASG